MPSALRSILAAVLLAATLIAGCQSNDPAPADAGSGEEVERSAADGCEGPLELFATAEQRRSEAQADADAVLGELEELPEEDLAPWGEPHALFDDLAAAVQRTNDAVLDLDVIVEQNEDCFDAEQRFTVRREADQVRDHRS